MNSSGNEQVESLLIHMDSLGDATRLRVLRLLEKHELGVAELSDVLQLPQSTISRHLKILSDGGWLRSRRVGTTHLSSMIVEELSSSQKRLWQLASEQTSDWPSIRQDELRLTRRLQDRQDDSRRFFTGAAAEWDRLRSSLYGNEFSTVAMMSLLRPDLVVVDLGCGTGQIIERLSPFVSKVVGVDNTPAMLKAARRRLGDGANIDLRLGDLEALPLADAEVDAALMVLALSYVAEPLLCVRELARVLKPGGRAVVVDIMKHDRDDFRREMGQTRLGFEPEEIVDMLRAAHFIDVNVRTLTPEPNTRGPALICVTAGR